MRTWVSVRFVVCGLAVLSALAGCGGSGASTASPSTSSSASSSAPAVKAMQISTSASAQGSVSVGQTFTLTPNVTGGTGKTLTFSVANAAPWMSFNSSTGVLTGTPTAADVNTYANIVISVSDGQESASTAPFTIQVLAAAATTGSGASGSGTSGSGTTGTADVSWTPPTTNTDGSTLTDLAGYNIYYGTSPTALTKKVQVSNIGVTNYVISGLTTGTWYFAVTAYSSAGTESSLSNVASKTIS